MDIAINMNENEKNMNDQKLSDSINEDWNKFQTKYL